MMSTTMKIVWLHKDGWPVEFIKGRPIVNFCRWLLLANLRTSWRQRGRWQVCRDKLTGHRFLTDTWCRFDSDMPITANGKDGNQ